MKKSFFAEFIGTFLFIFISGCAIILNNLSSKVDYFSLVVTFAVSLGTCYCLFAKVSGAHFNPSISFAYFLTAKMTFGQFILYTISQFLGGIVACIMLLVVFANKFNSLIVCINNEILKYDDLSAMAVIFIFEFIFSFIFVMTYMAADATKSKLLGGLVLSISYLAISTVLTYVDGCGLNIIRVVVPSLLYNKWTNVIYYVIADILGASIGGVSYALLFRKSSVS